MRCSAKRAWFGIVGTVVLAHAGPAWSQVTYAPVPPSTDQGPAVPEKTPPASDVVPTSPADSPPSGAPAAPPPLAIEPAQPAPVGSVPAPTDRGPAPEAPAAAPPAKPAPAVDTPTPARVGEVLKDVAKGDVKALRRGPLLIHGNYCGIGNRPGKTPTDPLDAACMRHDACTSEHSLPSCACDDRLRHEAMAIAEDPATSAEIKALATTMAASMVVLICK